MAAFPRVPTPPNEERTPVSRIPAPQTGADNPRAHPEGLRADRPDARPDACAEEWRA